MANQPSNVDGPTHCSECDHDHKCIEIVPAGEQAGFPNGEWMCEYCLVSNYENDPKGLRKWPAKEE